MKKQLKTLLILLISLTLTSFVYSQNAKVLKTSTSTNFINDSTYLKSLLIKLLKWDKNNHHSDFEPATNKSEDTIYTGINWPIHTKRIAELDRTNFFTKDFIGNYKKIALYLDKELKLNKLKYVIGELPPYEHPDEWCNCQDYPSNFWKHLKITNLKINNNSATFKWTWGDNFFYSIKTKKENNVWRIEYLEKFTIKNFSW